MRVPVAPKIAAALAALLLAGVGLTGCAESAASGSKGTDTIRYQGYQGSVNLPELAKALGYLDGVKLKYVGTVQGGPQSIAALVSNQVDYGAAFNGAIAQIASTGAPITSVISYYGSSDAVRSSILAKSDGAIASAKDLIGKKVAVNTLGANAEAVLDTYLAKGGLSQDEIKKVTLVPLPGINEEAALREGKVDAAYLGGALQESALSRPGLKVLTTDVDLVGPYNGGSIVLRDQFIKQNPDLTKKFVAGLAKAVDYASTHPVDEVKAKLQAWLTQQGRPDDAKALALWKGLGIATKAGLIRDQDFDLWLDWLKSRGDVKADAIKASDIYTNKYNPYAEEG
ncbi:ABC-type nitrate/sulfonate/bicarbonate transport system substrate-binding protein [Marmoricola sp. URHA0025 HA25]